MQGYAQKLFMQRTGKALTIKASAPSLIDNLEEIGILKPFELATLDQLLRDNDPDEETSAAVAFIALAIRHGHLCVRINGDKLRPEPAALVREEEVQDALLVTLIQKFRDSVFAGLQKLPEWLCEDIVPGSAVPKSRLVRYRYPDGRIGFYSRRNWMMEEELQSQLERLRFQQPSLAFVEEEIEEKIAPLTSDGKLLARQALAVRSALMQGLTVVTGGPGTGKSYTAAVCLQLYAEQITEMNIDHPIQVVLAAPTGKAAANLQGKLTDLTATQNKNLEVFPAVTLHSLLGMGRDGKRRNPSTLEADLIIVDECSMIDATLMLALLGATKKGARLILLGDNDQLPPVEVGSLFADFVDRLEQENGVIRLDTCVRAELEGIIKVAQAVNNGDHSTLFSILKSGVEGINWKEVDDAAAAKLAVDAAMAIYKNVPHDDPDGAYALFGSYRLLGPLRRGVAGIEAINTAVATLLYSAVQKEGGEFWLAPIIATANDYRLGIHNGEAGLLCRHVRSDIPYRQRFLSTDKLLFPVVGEAGRWREIPAPLVPRIELAYCLSVHKSQGSEFDHIGLVLPTGSTGFGKEVVYTGVTRARRSLTIYGAAATLEQTLSRSTRRVSGMAHHSSKKIVADES